MCTERETAHLLHREPDAAVVEGAEVMDGDDGGMLEARGGACLGDEALHCVRVSEGAGVEQLERDRALQHGVVDPTHLPHPPTAEEPQISKATVGLLRGCGAWFGLRRRYQCRVGKTL